MDESEHEMKHFGIRVPLELYQILDSFRVEHFDLRSGGQDLHQRDLVVVHGWEHVDRVNNLVNTLIHRTPGFLLVGLIGRQDWEDLLVVLPQLKS